MSSSTIHMTEFTDEILFRNYLTKDDLLEGFQKKNNTIRLKRKDTIEDSEYEDDVESILQNFTLDDTEWTRIFNIKLNIPLSIFITQSIIGIVTILFCMYMLIFDPSCESISVYAPLLTSVIGYFLSNIQKMTK